MNIKHEYIGNPSNVTVDGPEGSYLAYYLWGVDSPQQIRWADGEVGREKHVYRLGWVIDDDNERRIFQADKNGDYSGCFMRRRPNHPIVAID